MYLEHSGHECAEDEGAPEVPFPQQTLLLNRIEHVVKLGPNCLQVPPGNGHVDYVPVAFSAFKFSKISIDKQKLMEEIPVL